MKYALFAFGVIAGFMFLPFILVGVPEAATNEGVWLARAEFAGQAVAALAIGSLGLFYRKERYAAFVLTTVAAAILIWVGNS